MKKTRTLLAAAAAIAGLVALAGPAEAVPPQARTEHVDLPAKTLDTDGFCPFPVHIDIVTNQPIINPPPAGPAVQHITGFASATVTNEVTHKTLKFNISGPGTITFLPGGAFALDVAGPNLLYTTVNNSFPGVPQLAYTTGHVQVEVAANQKTTDYQLNGRSTDVCKLLAS
jgi:hypothetical protein